jgi:RNA-binding protein YhbY
MNKVEYRIDSKIIKQLSLYLMLHGVNDFNLSFSSNSKDVTFIISSKLFTEKVIKEMKDKLSRKREIEVEVYGWELLGDTDTKNQLDILGALIDEVEVKKENDQFVIFLKRKYKYSK